MDHRLGLPTGLELRAPCVNPAIAARFRKNNKGSLELTRTSPVVKSRNVRGESGDGFDILVKRDMLGLIYSILGAGLTSLQRIVADDEGVAFPAAGLVGVDGQV